MFETDACCATARLEPVELEGNLKFGLMLKCAACAAHALSTLPDSDMAHHLAFSTALERDVWMDQIQPYTNLNGALPVSCPTRLHITCGIFGADMACDPLQLLPRTGKSSSSYGTRAMTGMSKGSLPSSVHRMRRAAFDARF
eukprot:2410490-Rhodomonas_salina.1